MYNEVRRTYGVWHKIHLLLVGLLVLLLSGCNLIGGKTTTLSLGTIPASIPAGSQFVFNAFIDHNNGMFEGATWALTVNGTACSPGCGTLTNPTNMGSQGNGDTATITYTAPSTPPNPNSITITATSVENPKSSGSGMFTISSTALAVTTLALPQATVGVAYPNLMLQASGGTPPYQWSVSSGTVPAGLMVGPDGTVSGIPTAAGTFSFTVQLQDSTFAMTSAQESISVVASGGSSACTGTGGSESLLNGQYAFLLQGLDVNNGPDMVVGTFTADGAGNITAGEEDMNLSAAGAPMTQTINPASHVYIVGSDHRGCIALTTAAGTSVYRFVLGSINSGISSQGSLVEFDGNFMGGTMKLQNSSAFKTSAITGNYAFGFDSPLPGQFAAVGSFTTNNGTIGTGALDFNVSGSVDGTGTSGTPSSPISFTGTDAIDTKGRATFTFNNNTEQVNSVCYVVSAGELFCISSGSQAVNFPFAGRILQQSGGPYTVASVNGPLVRYLSGISSLGVGVKVEIALIQTDGAGNFNQNADDNDGGNVSSAGASGTYAVASNGRITIPGQGPAPLFYLYGPNLAFGMSTDPIVSFGVFEPQTAVTLNGNFSLGQVIPSASGVQFQTGEISLDGAGNLTGTADATQPGGLLFPDVSLAGIVYSIDSTGRGTLMYSGTLYNLFYVISPTKWVVIDITTANPEIQTAQQ